MHSTFNKFKCFNYCISDWPNLMHLKLVLSVMIGKCCAVFTQLYTRLVRQSNRYVFHKKLRDFNCTLLHILINHHLNLLKPTGGEVVREAGCWTNGPGFEYRIRHGCRADRPWLHQRLRSKTGRREVSGSFLSRSCRPSRSEFSVVFSETRVNTG